VATFSDRDKAERVKDYLCRQGLTAEVVDESRLQRFWFFSKSLAGQKVYVRDGEAARAMRILEAAEPQEHLLAGEVRCGHCGSARVQYPQFTHKFMMTTFPELFCFLGLFQRRCYCQDCHNTWAVRESLRPTTDVLGWPKSKTERKLVKKEAT